MCVLRLPNLPPAARREWCFVLFLCVFAGARPHIKNHYRGHKLSLWLHLIPQLHRPGTGDAGSRHHHFLEEGPQFYDGECCVRLCIIYTTRLQKMDFLFWTPIPQTIFRAARKFLYPFSQDFACKFSRPCPSTKAWKLKLISYSFGVLSQFFSRAKSRR